MRGIHRLNSRTTILAKAAQQTDGVFGQKCVAARTKMWDAPTMTVTTDAKKRVVLPLAKPGDRFDVQIAGGGKMVLTRLEPVSGGPAHIRIEKRGKHYVGVSDRPINEEALREALAEFP